MSDVDQLDMPWLKSVDKRVKPTRSTHPLDAMITLRWGTTNLSVAFAALDAGLQLGTRSSNVTLLTRNDKTRLAWFQRMPITFVDNDYHDYEHSLHMSVVSLMKPKYATVRDYMTERQCEAAGIPYYSLDEILKWAEDVERYAEQVIIIPKVDVLHEIPERYVLGYSVPTSYGGTPLPIESFAGRQVHLLGGSWAEQRRMLDILGDDVVSLDFNAIHRSSRYGRVTLGDGSSVALSEVRWDRDHTNQNPANSLTVCTILSMGFISAALTEDYLPRSARSLPRVGALGTRFIPWHMIEDEV